MKYSEGTDYKAIAVCVAKFNGNDQLELIKKLYNALKDTEYRLFIFSTLIDFQLDFDIECEQQIFELLNPSRFDAVIILSDSFKITEIADRIAERVVQSGTPCISLLKSIDGCINVHYNFDNSFEQVVRHVIEYHKVKNVNFIAGMKGNSFSEERIDVFRKVMSENGLEVEEDRIGYGDFWEIPTAGVMDNFLNSGKKIDAIICANDYMAMEACRKLRERGLKVPKDVIVTGFDGVEIEKYHYPRITNAYYDFADMAEEILTILRKLTNREAVEKEHLISSRFRIGQSCGCNYEDAGAITIDEMGVRAYSFRREIKRIEEYSELMYTKVPMLGSEEKLVNAWYTMHYIIKRFLKCEFSLYINDDFIDEKLELRRTARPAGYFKPHNYYTEYMVNEMHSNFEEYTESEVFRSEELMPDIRAVMDKNCCSMILPMHINSSTVGYAVCNCNPETLDAFELYSLVMNVRHIIEMHKSRLDQQNLFSTDYLTKLLNRKGFYIHMEDRIERAVKEKIPLAVISIDMNDLKMINDTFGHKEGDFALSMVGTILKKVIGDKGVSSRFGGDEFAAAFTDVNAQELCDRYVGMIEEKLKSFNESGSKPYRISVSIGSVCKVPSNTDSFERFMVQADKIMYRNKSEYKKHYTSSQ